MANRPMVMANWPKPPIGYRFRPTAEEIVTHYLERQVTGIRDRPCIIPEVDIYQYDPEDLPYVYHRISINPRDQQVQKWYFFVSHTPGPAKVQRSTPSGYWKKTGKEKEVKTKLTGRIVGIKEYLVFYKGRGKNAAKTNWIIHSYRLPTNLNGTHVLCRLKYKRDKKADKSTDLEREAIGSANYELNHQPVREDAFPQASDQARIERMMLQLQNAQTSNPHNERPVLMNWQVRPTDSVHGFVALKGKKCVVENKFNSSTVASEKPNPRSRPGAPRRHMASSVQPASEKCTSKDEEPRFKNVQQETAAINIKPERISLDETAARAKVQQYKECSSDSNSIKKKKSKEIEYAKKKSNIVAASTRTTSKSTKSSTNPPLSNLVNIFVAILLLLTITCLVLNILIFAAIFP